MVKVGSVVCVDFLLGVTCACVLVGGGELGFFCCWFFVLLFFFFFPSDRQDNVRRHFGVSVGILSAMIVFVFLSCLLFG